MKFVDQAKIYIESGRGGDGLASFAHGFRQPKGGPDGGDGGHGGSVIFIGDAQMETLLDYRYQQHFRATSGEAGGRNNRHGKNGEDCLIKVPPGTAILVVSEAGETEGEIIKAAEQFTALRGGRGGRGNTHFKSSVRRAPREATAGKAGQHGTAHLNLYLIADVGLIGKPNCGKSTLLNALTRAKSPSAAYPFTTLRPYLGVLQDEERRLILADLPGLIEGAAEGAGLGLRFLKHAQRTRLFLHLIDLSLEPQEIEQAYLNVRQELQKFSAELVDRPQLVAANKLDLCTDKAKLKKIQGFFNSQNINTVFISAKEKSGLDSLLAKLWETVEH